MHHPTDRITHTTAFVTPVVEHWLERKIAQWVYMYVCLYIYITTWKEGNVLFNDALHTFYLRLSGVGHAVKDHSDSERENLLRPLHRLLFPISSTVGIFMHHPSDRIAHTTTFVISVMEYQWVHHEGSIRRPIAP